MSDPVYEAVDGEAVYETLDDSNHSAGRRQTVGNSRPSWYHPAMKRSQATAFLQARGTQLGDFIVRDTKSKGGVHAVSHVVRGRPFGNPPCVHNALVLPVGSGVTIDAKIVFPDLNALVEYYQQTPLSGHVLVLTPGARESPTGDATGSQPLYGSATDVPTRARTQVPPHPVSAMQGRTANSLYGVQPSAAQSPSAVISGLSSSGVSVSQRSPPVLPTRQQQQLPQQQQQQQPLYDSASLYGNASSVNPLYGNATGDGMTLAGNGQGEATQHPPPVRPPKARAPEPGVTTTTTTTDKMTKKTELASQLPAPPRPALGTKPWDSNQQEYDTGAGQLSALSAMLKAAIGTPTSTTATTTEQVEREDEEVFGFGDEYISSEEED